MSLVDFRYRRSKPTSPEPGYFYWVNSRDNGTQIWFAPDSDPDNLILLNEEFTERFENIVSSISDVETDVDNLRTLISEMKTELTDSDYNIIAEKVNERTFKYSWKEI